MKDLEPINKILGMRIHRDRQSKKICSRRKTISRKFCRFNMHDCKAVSTPLPMNYKLSSSVSCSNEVERMELS